MRERFIAGLAAGLLLLHLPAAEAVQVRLATYNVLFGVGTPGSADYNAVRSVLQRTGPDIVAFQELLDSDKENWIVLAADLGYPYLAYGPSYGPLTGSQRLGFMSRHPIRAAFELKEYPGATELTRYPLRIVVDVPGALNPLVLYTVHHKASSGSVNQFRRGIEARRIVSNLVAYVEANPLNVEYAILGDFNEDVASWQASSFSSLPSGLPASYDLGDDVVFPVAYRLFPTERFAPGGVAPITPLQEDSSIASTYSTGGRLDYLLFSDEIHNSPYGAPQGEIYNSARDDGSGGLPKYGAPLPSATSANASDHYLVFADFNMIDALPCVNPVLFISEIANHPTSAGANFVELFNSGAAPLSLSNYAVVVYFDGSTPVTIPLGGSLGAGSARVLAANAAAFQAAYGTAADQVATNLLALNGNDVVALRNPALQISDLYGVIGEPAGTGDFSMAWAYPGQAAFRVPGVSDPVPTFLTNEWTRTVIGAATPGAHVACGLASVYYAGLRLDPLAPVTNGPVAVVAEIVPNGPVSNQAATAFYRLNSGDVQSVPMALASNTTWTTADLAVGAVAADVLYYHVTATFDGPGAAPVTSTTNAYHYPHDVTPPSALKPRFNEIDADTPGTDTEEFVELVAPAGLNLAGYHMIHYNGATGVQAALWRYDFPGFVVPNDGIVDDLGSPLGFCVVSQSNAVPNSDSVNLPRLNSGLQNGPDGLVLYDANSNIVDAVAWEGAGDLAVDDPGTVVTTGDPTADVYLHVTLDDVATNSLQAPNDVLGDTGAGWRRAARTPGAINVGQTSGFIRVSTVPPVDSDGDSFPDGLDNCPDLFNPTQSDLDNDGIGDACDSDLDGDGVPNAADNCPYTANAGQADLDGDGMGDACDPDIDNDGVENDDDNCPDIANPGQADFDDDGVGDACDPDDDNDGVPDGADNCPLLANPDQADLDGDGLGDPCDPDLDGDGIANEADNCPMTFNPSQTDTNVNGIGDACEVDTDGDGVPDQLDNCASLANPGQIDGDGDGIGDACDACTGTQVITNLVATGFANGLPPAWVIVTTGRPDAAWRFDDPLLRGNRTGGTGVFAIAESALFSRAAGMDTQLRTPPFDLANVTTAQLAFSTFFDYRNGRSNEVADVDISVSGTNGPWVNLWRRTQDASGRFVVDLGPYAGATGAIVRFHYYNAYQEFYWQVDDVLVTCAKCIPPSDGDGDGVGDVVDNCPTVPNPDQADLDGDGMGDVCDDDRDGDGLPDAWELFHFGSVTGGTAGVDDDTDGWSNLDEFRAGTDPKNPLSHFPALTNANGGSVMVLTMDPTETSRVYDVYWRTNLEDDAWQPFGVTRTGTGAAVDFVITNDRAIIFLRTGVRAP